MVETFKISFRLRNTYKANTIIYSLQSIPLLKKLMPSSLYANLSLKKLADIIAIIFEVSGIFVGKLIYISLMIFLASTYMKSGRTESFLHILVFLTLAGGVIKTHMFDSTKDKYYLLFLMRMDAKTATLSNYYYFLIKTAIGFLPLLLIFGRIVGISYFTCILMTVYIVAVKVAIASLILYYHSKYGKPKNILEISVVAIFLALAYIPPYFGVGIHETIFVLVCAVTCIIAVFGFRYLTKFSQYRQMYKEILTPESIMLNKQSVGKIRQEASLKNVETDITLTSQKSGYAYFNEIFIKRHNRILTRSAKRITLGVLALFVVLVIASRFNQEISQGINRMMLTFLPYFLFVMYILNRGKGSTEAMFMNCDHSMLAYRFYRQPSSILTLFVLRLKSVVWINLIPAFAIALSLPALLSITGGTADAMNYIVLFISIIVMSIFFSVHNMVLYYLFQPYNANSETKSASYSGINTLTYFICYFAIGKQVDTLFFGLAITAFCILYIIIALLLAYRLAPKTFKLRQ